MHLSYVSSTATTAVFYVFDHLGAPVRNKAIQFLYLVIRRPGTIITTQPAEVGTDE